MSKKSNNSNHSHQSHEPVEREDHWTAWCRDYFRISSIWFAESLLAELGIFVPPAHLTAAVDRLLERDAAELRAGLQSADPVAVALVQCEGKRDAG